MDPISWLLENAEKVTVVTILVFIILSGANIRGWRIWVYAKMYDDMVAEKNEWKTMALKSVGLAERTTNIAEKKIEVS